MNEKAIKFAELTEKKKGLDREMIELTNRINHNQKELNTLTIEFQDKVGRNIPRKVWAIDPNKVLVVTEMGVAVEELQKA